MTSESKDGSKGSTADVAGPPIRSLQLGVYRVVTEVLPPLSLREQWKKASRVFPTFLRLVKDVYSLSPWLFFLWILAQIWDSSIEPTLSLHLSSRVLNIIETGLKSGSPDGAAISRAVALRMLCVVFSAVIDQWKDRLEYRLMDKVDLMFQRIILRGRFSRFRRPLPLTALLAKLATDLTGVQANLSGRVWERGGWYTFDASMDATWKIAGTIGQLVYISRNILSTEHGAIFALVFLVQPVLSSVFERDLFNQPHVAQANDPHFLRMRGLRALSEPKYRQDIITGDIVQHVIQGIIPESGAVLLIHLATRLARDLPMLYYAVNAIINPSGLSLAAIATLHQSESLLSWRFDTIFYRFRIVAAGISPVKEMYDQEHTVHQTEGGDLPYPPLGRPHEHGMPIELTNVSFSYPGTTAEALDNITLSIKPGQLVVVVGANGSGKSTIVKLLTRLYDATSGSITVDGADIQAYRLADLRHATAALTQDHHLYPLSLRENIGLGNPAHVQNMEMIQDAARQGAQRRAARRFWRKALEKMTKEADVSGGERQRLVAARTFMRFTSGAVKLVCVDEPSSNLDPDAEWQLFQNLRQARDGKTMIFVTHRFAHLTKHADVILCMNEGKIIEMGTHEELMERDGEYCKMFKIQAAAFEETAREE
ncbi:ABC transporter ATP-binding protein [Mycena sanguinolenta]|uniref:ABC transporter ATP-binding protein n=1 Tax=Mycena sanguinolenta TaxID=230812 RepID=A0A8H7D515_9AGAR|nr:ABC transporter ATP-binding protein [Mycena sanguinolenta]